jgi:hypothetical protein
VIVRKARAGTAVPSDECREPSGQR